MKAIEHMKPNSLLVAGCGTGKTITALAFVFEKILHGKTLVTGSESYVQPKFSFPVFVITTALKRNTKDWEKEAKHIPMDIVVDSWNNISKYDHITHSVFIFDESHITGGKWAKSFIKIARANQWLLLSATPGDRWEDYAAFFTACGYYSNMAAYKRQHINIVYNGVYPKIAGYFKTEVLTKLLEKRSYVMEKTKFNETVEEIVYIPFDRQEYFRLSKTKISRKEDEYGMLIDECVTSIGALMVLIREILSQNRINFLEEILQKHSKILVFYNYYFELNQLTAWAISKGIVYGQHNGIAHEEPENCTHIFCQYGAAEAWNSDADAIVFYSLPWSYKMLSQAKGRIDRYTSKGTKYYYLLMAECRLDEKIYKSLVEKKNFNQKEFYERDYF